MTGASKSSRGVLKILVLSASSARSSGTSVPGAVHAGNNPQTIIAPTRNHARMFAPPHGQCASVRRDVNRKSSVAIATLDASVRVTFATPSRRVDNTSADAFRVILSIGGASTLCRSFFVLVASFLIVACSESQGAKHHRPAEDAGSGGDDARNTGGVSGSAAHAGIGGEGEGGDAGTPQGGNDGGGMGGAGEAGETPIGGTVGVGGTTANGGRSATGGTAGSAGGAGASGAAGGAGASGAAGSAGTAGTGNSEPCGQTIEITAAALTNAFVDRSRTPHLALFEFAITQNLGLAAHRDTLQIQFWNGGSADGADTGSFSLGSGDESNHATCSRCFVATEDISGSASRQRTFFQASGTLGIATNSQQMDGFPDFSYSDVTLREVTIDGDGRSTLVRDGTCLHLASGSFRRTPVWTCDPSFLTDGTCDCGCATPDPECPDSAASSCDWCWCGNGRCPSTENPTRNYTCL
jgi:hypothetical protein